jgi:hypothetical protein
LKELEDLKMVLFALPNVLAIVEKLEPNQFIEIVMPVLHQSFNYEKPERIPLMLLQSLPMLFEKSTIVEHRKRK